jgi:hypothetical protein
LVERSPGGIEDCALAGVVEAVEEAVGLGVVLLRSLVLALLLIDGPESAFGEGQAKGVVVIESFGGRLEDLDRLVEFALLN